MIEQILLKELESDNSSDLFQTQAKQIPIPQVSPLEQQPSLEEIRSSYPYFLNWRRPLEINDRVFSVLIIPQVSGNFVARTSTSRFSATGQGRNEEEAMEDIRSAIEILMEEEASPSGDAEWPEDYQ
jgi:predicted RNase H-like HicB family nuclease